MPPPNLARTADVPLPKRSRSLLRAIAGRALLVVGGVVLALVAMEIGVRIALPPPQRIELAGIEPTEGGTGAVAQIALRGTLDQTESIFRQTPTGKRLMPNVHAVVRDHDLCKCTVDIRTNSLGHRNREIGKKVRPRVLVLGDSITLADYVPEEQTWVRRMEALSEDGPSPIETINAGVWAIGLSDELAILLESGLKTDPDVVVLAWYLNDVQPSPGMRRIQPPPALRWTWLAQVLFQSFSMLRPQWVHEEEAAISQAEFDAWKKQMAERFPPAPESGPEGQLNQAIQDLVFDWGSAWSDGAWERMRPYFFELARQAEIHDFDLVIVAFPVVNQIDADFPSDYPQQRLKEIGAEIGAPVLDLLPLFRDAQAAWKRAGARWERRLFYDWCHHTQVGNEFVAHWVFDFLQGNPRLRAPSR